MLRWCVPRFLPGNTQGLSGTLGRSSSTSAAGCVRGTTRAPVFLSLRRAPVRSLASEFF